jgi:phosphoribosylamine--glycine ligase
MVWAAAKNAEGKSPRGSLARRAECADCNEVYCAPGNAGTAALGRNLPLDPLDPPGLVSACRELGIDLVVVGPEQPLAGGLVDALGAAGIPAFGPSRKASSLESSKAFGREFARSCGVPCAATAIFSPGRGEAAFLRYLDENRGKCIVLKKSGLAAGKGVVESDDQAELRSFGEAVLGSDELLAEEFLKGQELSVFALCTEKGYRILEPCADHKKAQVGDRGPNTGGMGAVSPLPFADAALMARIEREVVEPSFRGMVDRGLAYRGIIYFGLMLTGEGPRLLEYNVRLGDPGAQSLLPRMQDSFADVCASVASGRLPSPSFSGIFSCAVVVAAPGYPIAHPRGLPVTLLGAAAGADKGGPEISAEAAFGEGGPGGLLFHSATGRDSEGRLRTGGGRSFTAVGLGPDFASARRRAYELAPLVDFEGAWFRPDIGEKAYGK